MPACANAYSAINDSHNRVKLRLTSKTRIACPTNLPSPDPMRQPIVPINHPLTNTLAYEPIHLPSHPTTLRPTSHSRRSTNHKTQSARPIITHHPPRNIHCPSSRTTTRNPSTNTQHPTPTVKHAQQESTTQSCTTTHHQQLASQRSSLTTHHSINRHSPHTTLHHPPTTHHQPITHHPEKPPSNNLPTISNHH